MIFQVSGTQVGPIINEINTRSKTRWPKLASSRSKMIRSWSKLAPSRPQVDPNGAKVGPSWCQVRLKSTQMGPKVARVGAKSAQVGPKSSYIDRKLAQDGAKSASNRSKVVPKWLKFCQIGSISKTLEIQRKSNDFSSFRYPSWSKVGAKSVPYRL